MIFSDLHLDQYKTFATITSNGLNSRLMQQINVMQQVKKIARQQKVTSIFFLGDLFNALSPTISKVIYNAAFYLVQSLAELADVYLLTGNHDLYNNIHLFTPFSSIPRVKIINEFAITKVDGRTIDFIPWNSVLPVKKADYCFAHFGIQGATIGDGFAIEEEVKPQSLKDYKLVLAGHYHTRQQVANNAYQIGSVMNTNFSNTAEDKGVFLLNPENNELNFIPIPSSKFYTIKINEEKDLTELNIEPNNYYRLKVTNDNILIPDGGNNVIVEYDIQPSVEEKELIDTTDISNLKPIIKDFIIQSNTSLDKDTLYQKAIELLEV